MSPPRWLNRSVLAFGLVSLFTDVSSELIFPLLPIFLTETLRAPVTYLGLVEGAGDATAAVLKLWGGALSDRLSRRKPLALAGYGLSSAVRPLMALCAAPWQVLAVRTLDRVGKGIRTSPRDALLAESVDPDRRAPAFGFHRAMDHGGAMLGGLLGSALVALGLPLRTIFLWAFLPGAVAVLALALMAREEPRPVPSPSETRPASAPLPRAVVRFALVSVLLAAGGRSDAFLLLRAREVGAAAALLPLLWVGLHVVRASSAVPGGLLASRIGNARAASLGWIVAAASWALLGQVGSLPLVGVAIGAFGLYAGLAEGAERALVAELAPAAVRGKAFGAYHLAVGLTALPANAFSGMLWERFGAQTATLWGAATAAAAALLLLTGPRTRAAGAAQTPPR